MLRSFRSILWLFAAGLTAGCSVTLPAVNPRPNVVIAAGAPKFSQDVSAIRDDYEMDHVTITHFKSTLDNAFKNAVGSRYVVTPENSAHLVIEKIEPQMSHLGNIGRFVIIRFRGKWVGANGVVLAEFAGVAEPRNPTETGKRHLEDVVEVLYEKMISALNEAMKGGPAPAAPAVSPVGKAI